jgi:glycosyltransferase involved in cell wall biosynthesis
MRILVVHEVDFVRKVVYEWQEFPEYLARAGHEVSVLDYDTASDWADLREWGAGPKRAAVSWRLDTAKTFELARMIGPPVPGVRRMYAAMASWTVARRVIEQSRPDVVLMYSVPTCGLAILRAARRARVPVVFRSFDVLSQLVPRVIAPGVHLLERLVYPRCNRVLVSSPHLAAYIGRMSAGRARTRQLLLPIDTDRFAPARGERTAVLTRLGIDPSSSVAVFVGTLFGFAGLDHVIESWDRVLERSPDAHLLIVGGGPDEARLRAITIGAGHRESVIFTGMRPYEEVPSLIAAADVGICPFEIQKATQDINPTKVLQYLSCGVPCVCTPLPGSMAVLPEGRSGVAYAHQGMEFLDSLGDLLADGEMRAELGASGREWVVSNHAFAGIVDRLVNELTDAVMETSVAADRSAPAV